MCGIAGFSGDFGANLLDRMNKSQGHRGPDDAGIWHDPRNGVGLAQTRLSIIDLSSAGHQPMIDAENHLVVTYNGEIYNYREIRRDLENDGYHFLSTSDTEVLLKLYARHGVKALSFLNGIFAFAIWDMRKKSLFVARDGLGVKPLYYTEGKNGFLFASELKSILQEPSVDRSIDHVALLCYLTYQWAPAPYTPLKFIKKLEPGHALIVKDGRIQKKWQYYDLPYDQPIESKPVEQSIEEVRTYVSNAVERQMVADVPVGAFLSGGLDSSAVVAFARKFSDQKLQCFTIGFKDDAFEREGNAADLPYAKRVADHLNVDLHTIYVGHEMVEELEPMIYHLDEPQGDPAPINALFISRLAREHGIKVLLSGAGGDDIFTGYRRHYALMQERYWSWAPNWLRNLTAHASRHISKRSLLGRRVSKAMQYAGLNGGDRLVSYFYWADPNNVRSLFNQEVRKELGSFNPAEALKESLTNIPKDRHPLNRMLYLEGKHFLADHNLNYTDKMGMANGVEIRVPLLDSELVALAARLPVEYKQRGRTGKWIFKKAMEPYLPKEVIYRPKTGFGAPLRHWLEHELKQKVVDLLSVKSIQARGLFDPNAVQRLILLDRTGRIDGAYTIFALMCIEIWCRIFIDQGTPRFPGAGNSIH